MLRNPFAGDAQTFWVLVMLAPIATGAVIGVAVGLMVRLFLVVSGL